MLASLSHRARIALRQFIAIWIKPEPQPTRLPKAIAEALREADAAKARNDCRGLGRARQTLRQVRIDGLRREVAACRPTNAGLVEQVGRTA